MEATTDDTSTMPPAGQLSPEHVCMEDAAARLSNIQSAQQTVREQIRALEDNGIQTSVHDLKGLLPKLNEVQTSLRKMLGAHARPVFQYPQHLGLPLEILVMIFENVRGNLDVRFSRGVQGIQNVRLVCRDFYNASSHLLLTHLEVTLTTSSLDHLDEVSRHPIISKGVRSLWIFAALYDRRRAASLRHFTGEFVELMRSHQEQDTDDMQAELDDFTSAENSEGSSRFHGQLWHMPKLVRTVRKRKGILMSCTKYLRSEVLQPDEDENMATLFQLYKEYSQLLNDQKELLEYGTFVTRVAGAVARMPTVTGLTIFDEDDTDHPVLSEIPSKMFGYFREPLLETCQWDPEQIALLPQGPVELLYQLPLAISRAGNPLTKLCIRLDSPFEHSLGLSKEETKDLVSATEHLQVLELRCRFPSRAFQSRKRWEGLSKLARSFSMSTKLKSVTLDCGFWGSRAPGFYEFSFEPLLELLPWVNLNNIWLASITIHYSELKEHIDMLAPGTCIRLDEVYLLSGNWAELLDAVRGKADCNSVVYRPKGEEDEELGEAFTDLIEGWGYCRDNPASAYIRGQTSENPFRALHLPDATG